MKKVYLVSVFVSMKGKRLEEKFFAVRTTGYRAAQNAAARKFKSEGYDVDVACVERDEYGNPVIADTADEIKDEIHHRIEGYEADIAKTEQLTYSDVAGMDKVQCLRCMLPFHALESAKKKLAALEAVE